ncbi:hypothetical protein HDU99_002839, partial [Rhizoclosmatium hyalinum]
THRNRNYFPTDNFPTTETLPEPTHFPRIQPNPSALFIVHAGFVPYIPGRNSYKSGHIGCRVSFKAIQKVEPGFFTDLWEVPERDDAEPMDVEPVGWELVDNDVTEAEDHCVPVKDKVDSAINLSFTDIPGDGCCAPEPEDMDVEEVGWNVVVETVLPMLGARKMAMPKRRAVK